MTEPALHRALLLVSVALAAVTFVSLFFLVAPYGRHRSEGWGPTIDDTLGWVLMEAPSPIVFALCFALGERRASPASIAFLALWEIHYIHRAFIYPFRKPPARRRMPIAIAAMAIVFNGMNAYLNGRWLFTLGPDYPAAYLVDPRFLAGAALFAAGLATNLHADAVLLGLRKPGETGYKVPRGGAYRFVSCPNYLGEIVEWSGWTLATWSMPGLCFALWTAANLVPRALSHHRWYQGRFPDYPRERRALIPYLL